MTTILSIETATEICSISISNDAAILKTISLDHGMKHSAQLTSLIKEGMSSQGFAMNALDAVAISNGPGSYTGLRVGGSTAKAICYAMDIPLIAVSTLKALTIPVYASESHGSIVLSTIDARRMEAYAAMYQGAAQTEAVHALIWSPEVAHDLSHKYRSLVICGTGIEKARHLFEDYDHVSIVPTHCNASFIAELALEQYRKKDFVDIAYHDPFYFKSPNITTPKKKILE